MVKDNLNNNFLQSQEWREFQESVGRKTFFVESEDSCPSASSADKSADRFSASLIEHDLPIVGKYFYIPRGPLAEISNDKFQISLPKADQPGAGNKTQSSNDKIKNGMREIIELAKKENAGWIRFDPRNENVLDLIKENINYKIAKAPHDMQPKENFVIDISKNNEELLNEMSQKTRYNIRLAEKKGVKIFAITNNQDTKSKQISNSNEQISKKYVDEFLRLTKEMAERQGIKAHPEEYYRKMIKTLPAEMLKIYVAEYENKIIAANLMLFFNDTATYLHGASGNEYRNLMAPHLLQWQAILDAKNAGYTFYDFGGVKIQDTRHKTQDTNSWQGITKFKLGFSPETKPMEFPGSYDIIIDRNRYFLYRILQKIKSFL